MIQYSQIDIANSVSIDQIENTISGGKLKSNI